MSSGATTVFVYNTGEAALPPHHHLRHRMHPPLLLHFHLPFFSLAFLISAAITDHVFYLDIQVQHPVCSLAALFTVGWQGAAISAQTARPPWAQSFSSFGGSPRRSQAVDIVPPACPSPGSLPAVKCSFNTTCQSPAPTSSDWWAKLQETWAPPLEVGSLQRPREGKLPFSSLESWSQIWRCWFSSRSYNEGVHLQCKKSYLGFLPIEQFSCIQ